MKIHAVCVENTVTLLNEKEFFSYLDDLKNALLESGMYDNDEMDYFESTDDPLVILNATFGEDEYDYTFRTFSTS